MAQLPEGGGPVNAKVVRALLSLVVPVGLLAVWWFASASEASPYFPPLSEILHSFTEVWTTQRIADDLVPTLVALVIGFALATLIGVGVGLAFGLSDRLRRDFRPVTEFLRATPVVALVPIGLIVLGPGKPMEIALVAVAATWPILIGTADGVRAADQVALDTARVYGLSPSRRLFSIVIPGAMPQVMAGIRIATAVAVATVIVANMLGSTAGLGYMVITAQQSFNILETWAALLAIGVLGSALTAIVVLVERRVLRWHREWRALDHSGAS
jgi:sulfonate transport system permease protein